MRAFRNRKIPPLGLILKIHANHFSIVCLFGAFNMEVFN